jgi:competence protein ComEC
VPAAAIPIPAFPAWAGPAYYAALAGLISAAHAQGRRRIVALTLAVAAPLVIAAGELVLSGAGGPSVAILDVGDGQAVLLKGPGGAVLIDGGGSAARLEGELGQRLPPWQRELEALVLTAPGAGHVGGLPGFGREVREVLLPSTAFPGSAWRTIALSEAARGASVRRAHAGDVLELAGLRLEVLAPEVTDSGDDVGAGYLALRVVGPKHSFCDLSDLDVQAQMVAATHLKGGCDYLLLPAGGKSAPAPELMAIANPGQLVASRGSGRLARGLPASTLRTDQEGTIVLDL